MALIFDNQNNKIFVNDIEVASSTGVIGSSVTITPYSTITATNLQGALEQLADQNFRSNETPEGVNVEEGDIWYDKDDDQIKVYRETGIGIFNWVPIIVGSPSDDSDTLDAGAF